MFLLLIIYIYVIKNNVGAKDKLSLNLINSLYIFK